MALERRRTGRNVSPCYSRVPSGSAAERIGNRARSYVAGTGLVEFFAAVLAQRRRSPAGRPRTITAEALLVGCC